VFVVAAVVLALEWMLAIWLVFHDTAGPGPDTADDARTLHVPRLCILAVIAVAAVVLHVRSRVHADR
jgi:hypothetical protein